MPRITRSKNSDFSGSQCLGAATDLLDGCQTQSTERESVSAQRKDGYYEILKSFAMIGGSSVLKIAIGIVQTKAMALLLGPAGYGLFGLYGSISALSASIAGMGVNSSGVRQIAEAVGTGNTTRIAHTAAVLHRTSVVLGLLGAAGLVILSKPISRLTFGGTGRAGAVSLLSLVVLFTLVSGGQCALIQGMRRIADLAKMNILGSVFGLCTAIPLVYSFRQKGVVPSLIAVAGMSILTSWWYSRRIGIRSHTITIGEARKEAAALLGLGAAFMASSVMTMGVAYLVRVLICRKVGFEAMGLYQSAWTLGGLYVNLILQAMGADFYPRLTAVSKNNAECNRTVNEQTVVGLLLAGPGVLITLTFTPIVIAVFYSAKFGAAVAILRWICLGATIQVITWPMGFIIIAQKHQTVFIFAELAWSVMAIVLAYVFISSFGVNGAGMAFLGSYIFHCILIYPIVRRLSGFRWSRECLRIGLAYCVSIGIVFFSSYFLPRPVALSVGLLLIIVSAIYSGRTLLRLVPPDQLPRTLRRMVATAGSCRPSRAGF